MSLSKGRKSGRTGEVLVAEELVTEEEGLKGFKSGSFLTDGLCGVKGPLAE